MWYLISPEGVRIYIKPHQEIIFGRKNADFLLHNDQSISRNHASIKNIPQPKDKTTRPTSVCFLKDLKSKYGTYVYKKGIPVEIEETGCNLENEDIIRFGLQEHIFHVCYVPLVTATSMISNQDEIKLQNIMDTIDGTVSSAWGSACTYLTVSKAVLTEKVTCAMAAVVPIVTVDYWEAVKTAIESGSNLPNIDDFVPSIGEALINKGAVSVYPNENRRALFKNLIFVHFSSKQYNTYRRIIHTIGGKSVLYGKKTLTLRDMCAPNVVVVRYSNSDSSQATQLIVPEYEDLRIGLQTHDRRMVLETEIPLAILHCSVEIYCNPKFNMQSLLMRRVVPPNTSKVLALDTQDTLPEIRELPKVVSDVCVEKSVSLRSRSRPNIVIPETCDSFCQNNSNANVGCNDKIIPESDDRFSNTFQNSSSRQSNDNDVSQRRTRSQRNSQRQIELSIKRVSDEDENYVPDTNDLSSSDDQLSSISEETFSYQRNDSNVSPKRTRSQRNSQRLMELSTKRITDEDVNYVPETNDLSETKSKTSPQISSPMRIRSRRKYNLRPCQSTSSQIIIPETISYEDELADSPDRDKENLISQTSQKSLHQEEAPVADSNKTPQDSAEPFVKSYSCQPPRTSSSSKDEDNQVSESRIGLGKIDESMEISSDSSSGEVKNTKQNIGKRRKRSALTDNNELCKERPNKKFRMSEAEASVPVNKEQVPVVKAVCKLESPEATSSQPQRNLNFHCSLIRDKPIGKTFKKVYRRPSSTRISTSTMILWYGCAKEK